jgi:E3 ubiquitin-protein ligase RFWD2
VCSAVFCPSNANLLAVGTASCKARLYDVRKLSAPLGSVAAPRAVSYVRFMGHQLLCSIVDSSLRLHDANALGRGEPSLVRQFRGHTNSRNFVGLAVSPTGYFFSGSETNEVVMYHRSLPPALLRQRMLGQDPLAMDHGMGSVDKPIVSCLTVTANGSHVAVGGTTGWVNILRLV